MNDADMSVLTDAVARNCAVILSLPTGGVLKHHKSRLLGRSNDMLFVENIAAEQALLQSLIESGELCGVAFRSGGLRNIFSSCIKQIIPNYQLNETTTISALAIELPTVMKALQRRADYRVRVVPAARLKIRVWRLQPRVSLRDNPLPSTEIFAELRDLSVGGAGVALRSRDGSIPKISDDERLRLEFDYKGEKTILEGRVREGTALPDGKKLVTGIKFRRSMSDMDNRQAMATISKIIGDLQRDEVRRMRICVAEAEKAVG